MQNFRVLETMPPGSRASSSWGLCLQTPNLRRLGAPPPDPPNSRPSLQIPHNTKNSWGTASKSTLAPLFILQKRSIRLLTGSGYREHTNPLFYRAKCLKLKDIYSLETAKLMYKIRNNVLSFANLDKFNLIKNCYTHKTRLSHKNNFFLPRTRTRLGQKSLSFAGIKIWNEIPSSLKEVSFYRFKKAVKAHFLSTYETDKS